MENSRHKKGLIVNNLIICGKANQNKPVSKLKDSPEDEVWLCGTDRRRGADLYFEIHGIKVNHENVIRMFGEEIYYNESGLSPSNTISGMLIYAWLHGYTDITLDGCPMIAPEYVDHKATVVKLVRYLRDKGLKIKWEEEMATAKKPAEKKEEAKKPEQKESKTANKATVVKVAIGENLNGSWGTFTPGVYELDADLAKQFVKDKLAEYVK